VRTRAELPIGTVRVLIDIEPGPVQNGSHGRVRPSVLNGREAAAATSSRDLSTAPALLRRARGRCVGLPEPELVPVRVLAGREPAHARNRHRSFADPPSSFTRAAPALMPSTAKYGRVPRLPGSMFVIAAPCSPPICVVWHSNGPGFAWNCHPNKDPQNCWLLLVSSAGISMCTISPGNAAYSLHRSRRCRHKSFKSPGRVKPIGRRPDAGPPGYLHTRDRI
jgi:hypothetical protein